MEIPILYQGFANSHLIDVAESYAVSLKIP